MGAHIFYTEHAAAWEKARESLRIHEREPSYRIVPNGIALPPRERKRPCGAPRVYEGGICDAAGGFVAGLTIDSRHEITNSCLHAYKATPAVSRDTRVVFGGLLIQHFGHMLADSLNRLWFLGRKWPDCRIIFMIMPFHTSFPCRHVLELLHLAGDACEIIDRPTQFREIIVPDEACISVDGQAHREWLVPFDRMREHARSRAGRTYDKLYLTRRLFPDNDGVNEEMYEAFYRQQGYHVIAPEQLPFSEQVYLVSHANEIACTLGSLSHILLFCREGIRVHILLRDPGVINKTQLLINTLKHLTCDMLEATKNMLPTYHVGGTFLYCPTEYFRAYCADNGLAYAERATSDEVIVKYIRKWAENYSDPGKFSRIAGATAVDFVDCLTRFFGYPRINPKNFEMYHICDIRMAILQSMHKLYISISYRFPRVYNMLHLVVACIKMFHTFIIQRYQKETKDT